MARVYIITSIKALAITSCVGLLCVAFDYYQDFIKIWVRICNVKIQRNIIWPRIDKTGNNHVGDNVRTGAAWMEY